MKIINVLYKFLVLTKKLVFKHFLIKILFFASVLFFLSSFNSRYPEPTYYEIDFGDGVTHLWSREVYYDHYGFNEVNEEVTKKYNNLDPTEVTFNLSKHQYLSGRKEFKAVNKRKEDSIMWVTHPNYIESLDKYCVKEHKN